MKHNFKHSSFYFIALTALAVLCLPACSKPNTESRVQKENDATPGQHFRRQFDYFSTVIDVQLDQTDEAAAEQAFVKLDSLFAQWHQDWDAWGDGALGQLNQKLMTENRVTVSSTLLPLIKQAGALNQQSLGYFAPQTGALVKLWGFDDSKNIPSAPPPTSAILTLIDQTPAWGHFNWQNDYLIVPNSAQNAVRLDFGGFIKGAAVDAAIKMLRELGIDNAIVNTGGDLRAIGQRHDRPWRVGIKHPRENTVLASVTTLGDETVFTSGDYERFFEKDGRRYHHILNPHNGWPSQGLVSATVIGKQGARSDAAATALMAAGEDRWREVADSMALPLVMVIDNQGTAFMTKGMRARLNFETQPTAINIIN